MTNAELAILGLIAEQPRHGYQIEQVIEERGMRNWTEIGFSSIYYLLKKLEKAGYVTARAEQALGKTRQVYHPTPIRHSCLPSRSARGPCHSTELLPFHIYRFGRAADGIPC